MSVTWIGNSGRFESLNNNPTLHYSHICYSIFKKFPLGDSTIFSRDKHLYTSSYTNASKYVIIEYASIIYIKIKCF